jgi:DNA-binding NarL/FixJ family response regulator
MQPLAEQSIVSPLVVGRGRYLDAFASLLDASLSARGQVLAVAGEAGVGKSRLIAEVRGRVSGAADEVLVLECHCFEHDAVLPHAPVVELLRRLSATMTRDELRVTLGPEAPIIARLLPELATLLPGVVPAPDGDAEQDHRRLCRALAEFLVRLSRRRALFLIVEDLHWADEATLSSLLDLARRAAKDRLLFAFTYRADEVTEQLRRFLSALDRERLASEWRLDRLSREDVGAMICAIFGLPEVRAEFRDSIFDLTEGNPFFIEEVLKSLVSSGDIFYESGAWDRKPIGELSIPRTVQEAVDRRSRMLSERARELLVRCAVAGRSFDFALLERVSGLSEGDLVPLLKELVAAQLLVERPGDRFAFRHALTQQAVYSGLLARERRALHTEIAGALCALYEGAADQRLGDLAHHYYQAADWERAFDYASRVGRQAQRLYAPRPALQHFDHAVEACGHMGRTPPAPLLSARGKAHEALGDFDAARRDYEAALAVARDAGERRAEWQALIDLGALWAIRDYDRTGDEYRRAADLARSLDDPVLLARSLNRLGNWLANTGCFADSLEQHRAALELSTRASDEQGISETLDLLGMANGMDGDLPACVEDYARAIERFRAAGDDVGLASILTSRAVYREPSMAATLASPVRIASEALRDSEEAVQVAARSGSMAALAFAGWAHGGVLAAYGRFGEGLAAARRALQTAIEIEHRQWIAGARFYLGDISLAMLDPEAAREHLEPGLELARSIKSAWWEQHVTALLGLALAGTGALSAGIDLVAAAIPRDDPPRALTHRRLWWSRGELALLAGEPDEALRVADMLLGTVPAAVTPQPMPALDLLRGASLLALGRTDNAIAALERARSGAISREETPRLWRILAALGAALAARAEGEAARFAYDEARATIDGLAATIEDEAQRERFRARALRSLPVRNVTPRRAAKEAFEGLTEREREVAAHVTAGRSNREIAGILVLSERTVESHVGNILSKLGFSSRSQIAAWGAGRDLRPPLDA